MYRLLVFCLFLTSFLHLSRCSCFNKKKRYYGGELSGRVVFFCYNSKDFKADLKKVPVEDTTELEFQFTDIPKLENNALEMLPNLKYLDLVQCSIRDIEDNAFHGLSELRHLDLSENYLTTVKGSWFKELKLEKLYLRYNGIETIDEQFATTIAGTDKPIYVDLKYNQLKHLPANMRSLVDNPEIEGFVNLEHNPWSYKQALTIASWMDEYYVYPGFDEIQVASHNASMKCNNSLGMDVADDVFDKCVGDALAKDYKPMSKVH